MRHSFSLHRATGHLNRAGGFALTGRQFFQHRLTGAHELPQAGSPLTGGSFSAPADRGTRTALAGSPFRAGSFSLNLSGDSPSADQQERAAPPSRGKEGQPAVSFPLELLPFPIFLIWRRFSICDRCEKGYGRGFFLPYLSQPVRRVRDITAYTRISSKQARHNSAAQFVSAL